MRHALRNAAVPILTVIGLGIAILMGGAVCDRERVRPARASAASPSRRC
jgi:hypothetical protein